MTVLEKYYNSLSPCEQRIFKLKIMLKLDIKSSSFYRLLNKMPNILALCAIEDITGIPQKQLYKNYNHDINN